MLSGVLLKWCKWYSVGVRDMAGVGASGGDPRKLRTLMITIMGRSKGSRVGQDIIRCCSMRMAHMIGICKAA